MKERPEWDLNPGLCVAGAVLYQLSYQANSWSAKIINIEIVSICSSNEFHQMLVCCQFLLCIIWLVRCASLTWTISFHQGKLNPVISISVEYLSRSHQHSTVATVYGKQCYNNNY